jgi:hypothetical protein
MYYTSRIMHRNCMAFAQARWEMYLERGLRRLTRQCPKRGIRGTLGDAPNACSVLRCQWRHSVVAPKELLQMAKGNGYCSCFIVYTEHWRISSVATGLRSVQQSRPPNTQLLLPMETGQRNTFNH